MDRELLVAHSGGKLLPERVLFLETKEHPQISNASFWKRGRENWPASRHFARENTVSKNEVSLFFSKFW